MRNSEGEEYYDPGIDLREFCSSLYKRKWLIVGIVSASLIFAIVWNVFRAKECTEALIQLNFTGIEKHKYPDGSQFSMEDIIAPSILSKAASVIIDPEHRKVFIKSSRSLISIDPLISLEMQKEMKAVKNERKMFVYLPSQFYLKFTQSLSGIFSPEERKKVILAIINEYRNNFMDKFINQSLLDMGFLKDYIHTHDYGDVCKALKDFLNTYISFLDDKVKEAGYYRSRTTNRSFVDIKASLEIIRDTDLKELTYLVNASHVTKNKEKLIKLYRYRLKEIRKRKKKKEQEANIARQLLQELWQQRVKNATIATKSNIGGNVPGIMIDSSVLEQLSDRQNATFLLKKALEAEVEAKSLSVEEEYAEKDINAITKNSFGANNDYAYKWVGKKLDFILDKLQSLTDEANRLNQEYLKNRFKSVIDVIEYPRSFIIYPRRPMSLITVSFVLGFAFAVFVAFFLEYVPRKEKQH